MVAPVSVNEWFQLFSLAWMSSATFGWSWGAYQNGAFHYALRHKLLRAPRWFRVTPFFVVFGLSLLAETAGLFTVLLRENAIATGAALGTEEERVVLAVGQLVHWLALVVGAPLLYMQRRVRAHLATSVMAVGGVRRRSRRPVSAVLAGGPGVRRGRPVFPHVPGAGGRPRAPQPARHGAQRRPGHAHGGVATASSPPPGCSPPPPWAPSWRGVSVPWEYKTRKVYLITRRGKGRRGGTRRRRLPPSPSRRARRRCGA